MLGSSGKAFSRTKIKISLHKIQICLIIIEIHRKKSTVRHVPNIKTEQITQLILRQIVIEQNEPNFVWSKFLSEINKKSLKLPREPIFGFRHRFLKGQKVLVLRCV
jgi:hypothetical protein